MLQNLAVFGTFAAAAACVVYALYMFTQIEEPQGHRESRPQRPPRPPEYEGASTSRRRSRRSINYERMIAVIQSIQDRTIDCPICRELIRLYEKAWFCRSCSVGYHLTCVKHWGDTRMVGAYGFDCPSCRCLASSPRNTCMCGRSSNPNSNYSCNSSCQDCGFDCHPGPCILDQ